MYIQRRKKNGRDIPFCFRSGFVVVELDTADLEFGGLRFGFEFLC